MESRMHTFCDVRLAKRGLARRRIALLKPGMVPFEESRAAVSGAVLRGESERMSVAYAADVPASLWTATGAPTTPSEGATMLRWCTDALHETMTMATLLVPGAAPAAVGISSRGARITVTARLRGRSRRIVLDTRLRAAR
jgi:hypothetical protein